MLLELFWFKLRSGSWCLLGWWREKHEEKSLDLAKMGSGQFFVYFVIHLPFKLELFILQQNAVLFLTARILWQAIPHKVARCEIKIQLFLKFRWHDPIGLWYIISHFYYLNWEGLHKMKSFENGLLGSVKQGEGRVRVLNTIFVI